MKALSLQQSKIGVRSGRCARRFGQRRSGSVTLELILNLPIWIIVLLAIIQFGQLLSNLQQVALASRDGAHEASETPELTLTTASFVPSEIVEIVERQLESAGIVENGDSQCRIILEHNVGGTYVRLDSAGPDCDCEPPTVPPLPDTVPPTTYVRVTVCIPFSRVAPNLLGYGCLDSSTRLIRHTTTRMYELRGQL